MPARQSGSPRQQCSGAISAFVDSIDSHIILRMIRKSKNDEAVKRRAKEISSEINSSDWKYAKIKTSRVKCLDTMNDPKTDLQL